MVQFSLTQSQIDDYRRDGFLGPFTMCSPEEMAPITEKAAEVLAAGTPFGTEPPGQSRHLDQKFIWEVCSHPAIVDRMISIFGPDLTLWRSNFFTKQPGDKKIGWHQDMNYWPLEPLVNITAWVAFDEVTRDNSCVRIIPGSHRKPLPHVKAPADDAFVDIADPTLLDDSKAVDMVLKPGQFFLFNERTLHTSEKNSSQKRRMGLAVRVTIPMVRVDHSELFEAHRVIPLAGEDRCGFNDVGEPPKE